MKKIYIFTSVAFICGVISGMVVISELRIAVINGRSESNKVIFRKPLSKIIVEEFPTLYISVVSHEIKWSLRFLDKEIANNKEESLRKLSVYSGWAKEYDQDWSIIIEPSADLTVADLRSAVAVLYSHGFDRIWIENLVYGTAVTN